MIGYPRSYLDPVYVSKLSDISPSIVQMYTREGDQRMGETAGGTCSQQTSQTKLQIDRSWLELLSLY